MVSSSSDFALMLGSCLSGTQRPAVLLERAASGFSEGQDAFAGGSGCKEAKKK